MALQREGIAAERIHGDRKQHLRDRGTNNIVDDQWRASSHRLREASRTLIVGWIRMRTG
eukprot:COSAG01_NODE_2443_length_7689_cov_5.414229_6_plen_59_part_00